ncbi:hypothetical protein JZ751_018763 [Albula glossodonta]|uniref:Uncharacterized protein n=1 Tax=Albula glossodonta TaxID=121402 RepID=A0A8T2NN69_9TELE|nr:hypothetical protein JZ751_018763 [Albula glossodonta]
MRRWGAVDAEYLPSVFLILCSSFSPPLLLLPSNPCPLSPFPFIAICIPYLPLCLTPRFCHSFPLNSLLPPTRPWSLPLATALSLEQLSYLSLCLISLRITQSIPTVTWTVMCIS